MTEAQIQTIKALYEDYKKHLYDNSSYGSERYCQFIVFVNNANKEDNNRAVNLVSHSCCVLATILKLTNHKKKIIKQTENITPSIEDTPPNSYIMFF